MSVPINSPHGTTNKSPDIDRLTSSSRGPDSIDAQSIGSKFARLYHIYHSQFRYDYRVTDAEKIHLYFVCNSQMTPGKPDLAVHTGKDSRAPVAGVCKFIHFSRHCKVGLGDPQQVPGAMVWEDLQGQNLTMTKYRWQLSVRVADGGLERRSFLWKRTQSVGAAGDSPSVLSVRNFKLVDELTGQVVGVFTSSGLSMRKNGKLQVATEYGPDFELMALITLLAMYERFRRRFVGDGGGGGGDGGG
ncbi:hypothetical protein BJX61DRAFT_343719 [Aspergillus egyptiacus]|nr:hypothetical protein BJX61DRAFT_343719 [Aspergillus egyptiacus]